ncbi:dipeptide epimerase [Rhodothalassium salexigens]|uniref:enolase C-terminal domain-like protein n=1 Tax=Rhodothalassium salexigens TaxID=1086 RepID=UPI0019114B68|nr:dipeptide epimerase [Rhodothalassium salexigens]
MALKVHRAVERWPIRGSFTIARGRRAVAETVVVTLRDAAGNSGRGEAVPYGRYGETPASVLAAVDAVTPALAEGAGRDALMSLMPAGAARAAADAALWDLEAHRTGRPVWSLASVPEPQPVATARTVSLDTPDAMAAAARALARDGAPLVKLKLGRPADDADRLRAVRAAAPGARLVADVNEGWQAADLARLGPVCAEVGLELLEQPLPAGADATIAAPVPLCADESLHGHDPFDALPPGYGAVNLKLDKAGGLTRALALADAAAARGLDLFLGCMVATSLALAPALLLAHRARWVDLDGAWLLSRDRAPGLLYSGSVVAPAAPGLWGDG